MARAKKLVSPVTLFAAIEQKQHEALRQLAFEERRSLADVTRDALSEYLDHHLPSRTAHRAHKRAARH